MNNEERLAKALDRLIHANRDEIDNYHEISLACEEAIELLQELDYEYISLDKDEWWE